MSNMNVKLFLVAALYVALFSRVQSQDCKPCIKKLTFSNENGIKYVNQTLKDDGCKRDVIFTVEECMTDMIAATNITMESGEKKKLKFNTNDGQKDVTEKMGSGGEPESSSDDDCAMKPGSYWAYDLAADALKSLGQKASALDIDVTANNGKKVITIQAEIEYKGKCDP